MGIGDYLTLRFFWEVRDEGSWLEIGESISMFVIASLLCIFVAGLEAVSELFVRGVEFGGVSVWCWLYVHRGHWTGNGLVLSWDGKEIGLRGALSSAFVVLMRVFLCLVFSR
jgi:hypothetical protein